MPKPLIRHLCRLSFEKIMECLHSNKAQFLPIINSKLQRKLIKMVNFFGSKIIIAEDQ